MTSAGLKTTLFSREKVPNSKSLLSFRFFDANVVCNVSGNVQELKIFERISILFTVEDDNLSVGPRILCKTCYRRIEKFKRTIKEVANLN